ncbi:MAG: hypothetical protein J5685_07030 [Clostridiales bacterium]|nr:hypothetical protein [Clostridiales bacterium]
MEKTKGHVCPTCAGTLRIDEDRRLYICPFCGVSFDYEYFREDDVLQKGNTNLSNGEFKAATEAFKFMLAKDPHNFEALRGLVFAAAGLRNIDDLSNIGTFRKLYYKASADEMQLALEKCLTEDKPFFETANELFTKGSRYNELKDENGKLSDERKFHYREIDRQNQNSDYFMFHVRSRDGVAPVHPKVTLGIWVALWVVMTVFLLLVSKAASFIWIIIGFLSIPVVIVVALSAYKLYNLSKINAVIKERDDAIKKLDDQIKKNDDEADRLKIDLHVLYRKLVSGRK